MSAPAGERKKKSEIQTIIVEGMMAMKNASGVSYRAQCHGCAVAYSSLMRWKRRRLRGQPTVRRPGPAKIKPLDLANLEREIQDLSHGRHRSAGVGAMRAHYQDSISRRDLQRLVAAAREQAKRQARQAQERIHWHRAGLVWSMDDLEFEYANGVDKIHVHAVEDLGSRFKLPPLVGTRLADGATVAEHLEGLFQRYGPPLFLKRDNHGNLNNVEVDGVMERALVLPLNSPPNYPPYNGGMERAQRELKEEVQRQLAAADPICAEQLLERVVDRLNHQLRPCLAGQTSCAIFSLGCQEARLYSRIKRREVCACIKSMAARIVEQSEGARPVSAAQAWRVAAENWLQRNGVISIARGKECYLFP
jgi:hypothetical protein